VPRYEYKTKFVFTDYSFEIRDSGGGSYRKLGPDESSLKLAGDKLSREINNVLKGYDHIDDTDSKEYKKASKYYGTPYGWKLFSNSFQVITKPDADYPKQMHTLIFEREMAEDEDD
tara:strand:+ start:48 stop:395 length:348 start_codon:yes stop_codon:yes gene_type:complete